MVYLKLYVKDIKDNMDFYTNKLELFTAIGDRRLVCKPNPNFIIDLRESEKIRKVDFGIHVKDGISILSKLDNFNIPYELSHNIASSNLYLEDINGNTIWLSTECGELS